MTGILTRVAPFTIAAGEDLLQQRRMVAKHTEELGNGMLVQAGIVITAEPRGYGEYQEWRASKRSYARLDPFGDPTILFTYFRLEANISIFHYGQKILEERGAANVSDMGWEDGVVDLLVSVSIGPHHVHLVLEGKGGAFKGFPVTPELQKEIEERRKKNPHSNLYLDRARTNPVLYLERQLRKQSKSRKPCSFPRSMRVEFTEEESKA